MANWYRVREVYNELTYRDGKVVIWISHNRGGPCFVASRADNKRDEREILLAWHDTKKGLEGMVRRGFAVDAGSIADRIMRKMVREGKAVAIGSTRE